MTGGSAAGLDVSVVWTAQPRRAPPTQIWNVPLPPRALTTRNPRPPPPRSPSLRSRHSEDVASVESCSLLRLAFLTQQNALETRQGCRVPYWCVLSGSAQSGPWLVCTPRTDPGLVSNVGLFRTSPFGWDYIPRVPRLLCGGMQWVKPP